jgi:type IV pilus assembly protein PilF
MARCERREAKTTPTARVTARYGGVAASPLLRPLAGLPRWTVAVALTLCLAACARTGRGANAADSDRQSEAEYDVARDLFLARRDPRGALGHAQKAVELNENSAEAQHLVALIYLYFCSASPLDCRLPEAEKAARQAVKLRPDFREAQNTLGVILIQAKKYDEAVAVLDPLAHDILYQTPWDAWGNLGLAYLEKGKVEDAVTALKRSVTAEPRFCVGNYRLGLAFEKKGDLSAARQAFSQALETNRPECQSLQDAFEARARVHSKSKDCELAKGDWEKCRDISPDSPAGLRCVASLKSSLC